MVKLEQTKIIVTDHLGEVKEYSCFFVNANLRENTPFMDGDISRWCVQNFGPSLVETELWTWFETSDYLFVFANENDAAHFKLRWEKL